MNPGHRGTQSLAIFAILFLLGFGFVVYAVPQAGASSPAAPLASDSAAPSTATAIGNGLSYALVPLPVYLHQPTPANYSFKEGGALIVATKDKLQVTTSFSGSPGTRFTNVLETGDRNITLGKVTTGPAGAAIFRGNVTLDPGTYQVGLLIFVSDNTSSPVGVSLPGAIQITLPSPAATTTSSTTSTRSRSSSTNTTTFSSTTASQPAQASTQLEFAPVTVQNAPRGYLYGEGGGGYAVTGGSVYFSLSFAGQNPSTRYSLVLSVNGTAKTIGDYTTTATGQGTEVASASLGAGRFVLSVTVLDLSSFGQPTEVLASVPSSFIVNAYGPTTSSTTGQGTTSSSVASSNANGPMWAFKLVRATVENVPAGYRFAGSGTAVVSLDAEYSLLDVAVGFQDANPSTTYNADLILNGTAVNLGTMTTNRAGGAVLQASIQVSPGKYQLGVMVYDVSDASAFKADGPVLVLVSDPTTQLAIIQPLTGESSSTSTTTSNASLSASSSQSTTSTLTQAATTIGAGTQVQAQIQNAVDNLTIPATVEVTPLSSSTNVLDSRFSLSVGPQAGNGLVIAISGENVTGPRVLLINMTKTDPLALYPALNVTLDGQQVVEASSAIQVLNPVSSNPPMYVLVATSNSIQLLVSIPHFSLHLIEVAGVIVHTLESAVELDTPLLAGAVLVITLAFVGAYLARKRFSVQLDSRPAR